MKNLAEFFSIANTLKKKKQKRHLFELFLLILAPSIKKDERISAIADKVTHL